MHERGGGRIQDPNRPQRTMMLGIGFRERDTALDFKQTLNDYVRFVDRMAAAAAASLSVGDTVSAGPRSCHDSLPYLSVHVCVHIAWCRPRGAVRRRASMARLQEKAGSPRCRCTRAETSP